ncbi:MAG TPA: hypothetical protein VFP98_00875, partial [Candidatus Polarisedimenticolia bacterium]|nr:hypothetical protein [Candidatus Polarisedimenticolia bacterium]
MSSPLHPSRARVAFATVCLLLSAAGCGKKGQPMPPLRNLPEPVASLRARQVGDRIVLSMATPASRTDGAALGPEAALEILMVARDPAPRKPADLERDPAAVWAIPANQFSLYAEGARLDVGFSLETIAS